MQEEKGIQSTLENRIGLVIFLAKAVHLIKETVYFQQFNHISSKQIHTSPYRRGLVAA
jgi:hypothetical protein